MYWLLQRVVDGFLEVQIHEEQRTDLKNELGSFVTVVNIPETQG